MERLKQTMFWRILLQVYAAWRDVKSAALFSQNKCPMEGRKKKKRLKVWYRAEFFISYCFVFSIYGGQTYRAKQENETEITSYWKETRRCETERWKIGRLSLLFLVTPRGRSGRILGQVFRSLNNEPVCDKMFGTQQRAQDVIQTCLQFQIKSCLCIYFFLTVY